MNSICKIELAKELCRYAHDGQTDKAGAPYWKHPFAVADIVSSDDAKVVAYLHDVVEDTSVKIETIYNLFGSEIGAAVQLLTHDPKIPYLEYIQQIRQNELARTVKLADLHHNMDLSRLSQVTAKDLRRLAKYQAATDILTD